VYFTHRLAYVCRRYAGVGQKADYGQRSAASVGSEETVDAGREAQVSDANAWRQQRVQSNATAIERGHQRQRHIQRQPKPCVRAGRRRIADADDKLIKNEMPL